MKIILTFSLFVLSTTILFSAPGYYVQIEGQTNHPGNNYIHGLQNELKLHYDTGAVSKEPADKDEISSLNSSLMNFQSLERGRRKLEKKYNLYT